MFRNLTRPILDFMLPPRCPGCGAVVDDDHRFCAPCWLKLDFLTDGGCATCSIPLDRLEGLICGACLKQPPRHDGVRAVVAYGDVARRVVLRLKYTRRPGMARTIATLLASKIDADAKALLLPVPLHRSRLWSRGFNQAALIATALARTSGNSVDVDLLLRHKRTPSLRGIGSKARSDAVRGAFSVRTKLAGRDVYLVDDVYTTGATANACAAVLKRAGAGRVIVLCWARVVADD